MKIDKRFHDKYHAPYGVIHRADMLNVILDACKKSNLIKLAISQKVVAIDDTGSGVTVKTESGETYQGRGADRLRRAVVHGAREDRRRRQAGGLRPHRLSRRAADLRMAGGIPPAQDDRLVRREDPSGALSAPPRRAVQPRRRVPLRPLRGGLGHLRRSRAELHARFADKCEPVRTLLQKVNAWKMWVLCDRPAIKNWTKGRITLLGDAAHPMLQYLAQGGNTAMEDAVCLANQVEAMPRRLRGGVQEIPGAALSAHRARAADGARVRRDLSRQRRQSRVAQQGAARMERTRRRRHVVALRRAAGAAACRQHADAAADAARRRDQHNRTFIREENRSWRSSTT